MKCNLQEVSEGHCFAVSQHLAEYISHILCSGKGCGTPPWNNGLQQAEGKAAP